MTRGQSDSPFLLCIELASTTICQPVLAHYRSIYNSLCSASHNNLRSLVDRHIEFDAEDFTMVFYKAYTPEDAAIYVGTNSELLVRATEKVHEALDSGAPDRVAAFRTELNRLRGDVV